MRKKLTEIADLSSSSAPAWSRAFRSISAALLPYTPTIASVRGVSGFWGAALRSLGATLEPLPDTVWTLGNREQGSHRRAVIESGQPTIDVLAVHGVVPFELDGVRYLLGEFTHPYEAHTTHCVVAGPSLEHLTRLAARVREAWNAMSLGFVHVYGEGSLVRRQDLTAVAEEELVLPPELKRNLLSYFDWFVRGALESAGGVGSSRGMLLLGPPGTGKTLTIRHLLGRREGLGRFMYAAGGTLSRDEETTFEGMTRTISEREVPSIVVVEDLDRLFSQGRVTPQYFLNVLDGLLEPRAPVLWIATANDPSELEENLLDRPGRFDRVLVFERPATDERRRLFERYADAPLEPPLLDELVAGSEGLTGAHIREVCHSALFEAAGGQRSLAEALRRELERMRGQHLRARDYGRGLKARAVGF